MYDDELSYDDITAIAEEMDLRKILHLYVNVSFEAACDEMSAQIDKIIAELPERDTSEEWLDNVNRARDIAAAWA